MMPHMAETAVHAWLRSARVQISAIVNPRKPFMFLNEKNSTTAPYLRHLRQFLRHQRSPKARTQILELDSLDS